MCVRARARALVWMKDCACVHACARVCVSARARACDCARVALLIQYAARIYHIVCGLFDSSIFFDIIS